MRKVKRLRITLNSFEVFDKEAFCQYLEQMADKGWMIKKVHLYYVLFERCLPQSLTFGIDFETFPKEMMEEDKNKERTQEYIALCEESGWTFATAMEKGYIFYHDKKTEAEPLCSDEILHFETYVRKTVFVYSGMVLFVFFYLWMGRDMIFLSNIERMNSFDLILGINMWLFFLPSISIRYIRYFVYVIRNYLAIHCHGKLPQMHATTHAFYHRYYRISQSLFLWIGLPFTMMGMFHILDYTKVLYTLLTFYTFLCIGGNVIIDIWMYYMPSMKKHRNFLTRIPYFVFIIALGAFSFVLNRDVYKPIASCAHVEGIILPEKQEAYCDGRSEVYHSFYIHGGSKTNVYTLQGVDDYQFFATSTIYQMRSEAKSKSFIKEMMIRKNQEEHSYIDLPSLDTIYPEKVSVEEIMELYEALDPIAWKVDEAYRMAMPKQEMMTYIFRKGSTIFEYTFADTIAEDERTAYMKNIF